jgi:hypothetical protein
MKINIVDPYGISSSASFNNVGDPVFYYGGGNFDIFKIDSEYRLGYGSFTITPEDNFVAWVELWGADGGSFGTTSQQNIGGIGGYTKALVKFKKDISYTVTLGQAGGFGYGTNHGGGGAGSILGGKGGGLSGLFIDTQYHGKEPWTDDHIPVTKEKTLLIAAGGGGKGGTMNQLDSAAGNGGGWMGSGSYNSTSTMQEKEGSNFIGRNGDVSGNNGGGGGGWVGGETNTDSRIRDVGGSGGSGHICNIQSSINSQYAEEILTGFTTYGSSKREDIYKFVIDPTKFTVVQGVRGQIDVNKYKNIYTPQHGRVIITLADEDFDKKYYPEIVTPYYSYATINI